MKSLTLIRGAAVGGALMLMHASVALAAGGTGTTSTSGAATGTGSGSGSGENTVLHLGPTSTTTHASGGSGSIVRTIVGLAIVIAVIYGLSWVLRQAKSGKNKATGNGLTQVANLPLGTGRSVSLVRVGSELHLLGIAEHNITTIRVYTEEEALDAGLIADDDGDSTPYDAPIARAIDVLRRMTAR
jgi:flagellar protein FliO/FliZ